MVGFDDNADIIDFDGKRVGWLKMVIALGSPDQVNFFDRIQNERDKVRAGEEEEKRSQEGRKQKGGAYGSSINTKEVESLIRELIYTIKGNSGGTGKKGKDKWSDSQLESLRKLFEECRLEDCKDIISKVFIESASKSKNTKKKVVQTHFEKDLINHTSLNKWAISNILKIWDYRGHYDLEELQHSYSEYCRNSNYAEDRVRRTFEKLHVFFGLSENNGKFKDIPKSNEKDAELKNKELAAMWCRDNEMKDGLNIIIDLFQANGDHEKDIDLQEFLEFVRNPPPFEESHI
jgi:hypothetical protein